MGKRRKSLRRQQLRVAAANKKSTLDVLVPNPAPKTERAQATRTTPAPKVAPAPKPVKADIIEEPVHASELVSPRSPKLSEQKPKPRARTRRTKAATEAAAENK